MLVGEAGGDAVGALHVELHVVDVHAGLGEVVEAPRVGHLVGERDGVAVALVGADRQRLGRRLAGPDLSLFLARTKILPSGSIMAGRCVDRASRSPPMLNVRSLRPCGHRPSARPAHGSTVGRSWPPVRVLAEVRATGSGRSA